MKNERKDALVRRGEAKFAQFIIGEQPRPASCRCNRCFDAALDALVKLSEEALYDRLAA